jgi:AcrR family transcriptional regulator
MTTRGERTREHLLDVAEQLLSRRGIDSVSLREIRLTAGQRNTSALQFHFGDREGLLRSLSDRHRPRLQGLLVAHYQEMIAGGREGDPRSLLGVFVRPTVDYVFEGPSPRAWVRILAELAARPELKVHDFVNNTAPEAIDTGTRLLDSLQTVVPRRLGFDRVFMVTLAVLHLCADRARLEDSPAPGRRQLSQREFTENVVDMAHGALFAPVRETAS